MPAATVFPMPDTDLAVPTTLAEVARATQQVRAALPGWLDAADRDAIELGVAEALTNVVEHGYGGDAADLMRVLVHERAGAVEIEVWDRGRPIPAGLLEQADHTTFLFDETVLDQVPEGGLGLALIKTAFHEVSYRSRDGMNRLRLVRRL